LSALPLKTLLSRIELGESEARFILLYGKWLLDRNTQLTNLSESQALAVALYSLFLRSGLSQIQAAEATALSKDLIDHYLQSAPGKDAILVVDGQYLAVPGFNNLYDLAAMRFCLPAEVQGKVPVSTSSYHLEGIRSRILF